MIQSLLLVAAFSVSENPSKLKKNDVEIFLSEVDFRKLQPTCTRWRKLDTDSRKQIIVELVNRLYSSKEIPLTNYADLIIDSRVANKKMTFPGHGIFIRQDIFIEGGRCAWALEQILGINLPAISEGVSEEERLRRLHEIYVAIISNAYNQNK